MSPAAALSQVDLDEAPAPKKEYKGGYKQINKALNICAFEDYLQAQTSRLPYIADVEQISPRVLRVLGQNAGKVNPSPLLSSQRL
jgi:hypothetical protein